jgi:hypothetical protein
MDMVLVGHRGQVLAAFEKERLIKPCLRVLFAELGRDGHLVGTAADRFAGRAAHYIAEINRIHPFREGNGRTMRFWLRELAAHAGLRLELKRIDPDRWIESSIASHSRSRDHGPMTALIRQAITGKARDQAHSPAPGELSIEAARLAVLLHLPAAKDQAAGRLAALNAMRSSPDSATFKSDVRRASNTLDWLRSHEDGPRQRLELLRAAGVPSISLPSMDGMIDLERVSAIGKACQRALKALPPEDLERARHIIIGRTRH